MSSKIEQVFEGIKKIQKKGHELSNQKDQKVMQHSLHEEKTHFFLCQIISLYTINNLCVELDIPFRWFSFCLKIMTKNTFLEPQPESSSNIFFLPVVLLNMARRSWFFCVVHNRLPMFFFPTKCFQTKLVAILNHYYSESRWSQLSQGYVARETAHCIVG